MKKTSQTKKSKSNSIRKPLFTHHSPKEGDALAVIRDASNGKEYYLSMIDSFVIEKIEYVVMYNYEPDDGNHPDPELVIMRTEYAKNGDQYFYSIKNESELEAAFTVFMRRYAANVKDKKPKNVPGMRPPKISEDRL
ncbi:MAG: DUF1292 domain-containing protein [Clostridiales bacterium]|jgi:hypothetical protein|nr:DUF1292 domain-containing protein [Clostridiales bacterium]MBR5937342.1 DUF1292 domain-containing protein [Clostridiales bacterium]